MIDIDYRYGMADDEVTLRTSNSCFGNETGDGSRETGVNCERRANKSAAALSPLFSRLQSPSPVLQCPVPVSVIALLRFHHQSGSISRLTSTMLVRDECRRRSRRGAADFLPAPDVGHVERVRTTSAKVAPAV